jgi:hypothetical protein
MQLAAVIAGQRALEHSLERVAGGIRSISFVTGGDHSSST